MEDGRALLHNTKGLHSDFPIGADQNSKQHPTLAPSLQAPMDLLGHMVHMQKRVHSSLNLLHSFLLSWTPQNHQLLRSARTWLE